MLHDLAKTREHRTSSEVHRAGPKPQLTYGPQTRLVGTSLCHRSGGFTERLRAFTGSQHRGPGPSGLAVTKTVRRRTSVLQPRRIPPPVSIFRCSHECLRALTECPRTFNRGPRAPRTPRVHGGPYPRTELRLTRTTCGHRKASLFTRPAAQATERPRRSRNLRVPPDLLGGPPKPPLPSVAAPQR